MGNGGTRRHWVVLGAIVVLAAALRWPGLTGVAFNSDEAWTLLIRESPASSLLFEPIDPTGGLYYLFAKAVGRVTDAPLAIRWLALAFNLATIVVAFCLGRKVGGRGAGLVAAGVIGAMSLSVFTGQSGRAYALAALSISVSALGLLGWLERRGRGALALFAAGAVAAFYTHPTSVFWIAPAVYMVGRDALLHRGGARRRAVAVAAIVMALLALPEMWRAIQPEARTGLVWIVQPGPLEMLWVTARNLMPVLPGDDAGSLAISAVASLAVLLIAFAGQRGAMPTPARTVTLVLLSYPVWLWLFGYVLTPVFMHRALMPAAVGFAMLVGWGAVAGRSPRQAMLRGAAIVALYALVGGRDHYVEPWGRVRDDVARLARPGDVLLVCPFWQAPALLAEIERRPLPVALPLLQWRQQRMWWLGAGDALDRDWARRWNATIYRLDRGYAFDRASEVGGFTDALLQPRRALVVGGDCPADEAAEIGGWLGRSFRVDRPEEFRVMAIELDGRMRAVRKP